jgi:hypothetical protein
MKHNSFPAFTHLHIPSKTLTHNITHTHAVLFLTSAFLHICQEVLGALLIDLTPPPLKLSLGITSRKVLAASPRARYHLHPVGTLSFIHHAAFQLLLLPVSLF